MNAIKLKISKSIRCQFPVNQNGSFWDTFVEGGTGNESGTYIVIVLL
jgi:hypothetical protein